MQKKPYAVTENAVELTKKLGKNGASGFVNAILRKFATTKIDLPKEEAQFISVKYSFPQFAVKELIDSYGKDRVEKILSVQNDENTLELFGKEREREKSEKSDGGLACEDTLLRRTL